MKTAAYEIVTPEQAERFLSQSPGNRQLDKERVKHYAQEMKAGKWVDTGEAIQIDRDGYFQNGHHRLNAVIECGKPVEILVVRGIDPEARNVIDTGTSRTPSHILQMAGYKDASRLAAAIRIVHSHDIGKPMSPKRMHPRRYEELITTKYEDLQKHLRETNKYRKHKPTLIAPAILDGYSYIIARKHSLKQVHQFLEKVIFGLGLIPHTPEFTLNKSLIIWASEERRRSWCHSKKLIVAAILIKAWNLSVDQKPCKQIRWNTLEDFPEVK